MRRKISFTGGRRLFCVLAAGLFLLSACGKTEDEDRKSTATPMESNPVEADFAYRFVAESENGYYECNAYFRENDRSGGGVSKYYGGSSDMLFGECQNENDTLCFLDLNRPVGELQWEELKEN